MQPKNMRKKISMQQKLYVYLSTKNFKKQSRNIEFGGQPVYLMIAPCWLSRMLEINPFMEFIRIDFFFSRSAGIFKFLHLKESRIIHIQEVMFHYMPIRFCKVSPPLHQRSLADMPGSLRKKASKNIHAA